MQQSNNDSNIDGDLLVGRIGKLTRKLRDSLLEMGLDKEIEKAAAAIPDARDRLNYVVQMTKQAAERSLNAIDNARPLQDKLEADAKLLDEKWQAWFAAPMELDEARDLVQVTRQFLADIPHTTGKINNEMMEILMAQDFQDLTGQVIKKLMTVIKDVEDELVQVLLESVHGEEREKLKQRLSDRMQEEDSLENGPQVNTDTSGVVSSQEQVDDLLDQLGF